MAAPFTPDQPFKDINVINESERDATPANDAGRLVQLEDDGRIHGSFLRTPSIEIFTTSGTWTKDAGLKYIVVEVQGGGGGGAGHAFGDTSFAGVGGASGGYSKKMILASALGATETVTIGAGGTASTGNGGTGGTSSFGSHCSATGGAGGTKSSSLINTTPTPGQGSDGDLNIAGNRPERQQVAGNATSGASSALGSGGNHSNASGFTGESGVRGGGGGGTKRTSSSDTNGGGGGAGIVIVTEYY